MKKYKLIVSEQNQLLDLIYTLTEHLGISACQFSLQIECYRVEFITPIYFTKVVSLLNEYLVWDLDKRCVKSIKEILLVESCAHTCNFFERNKSNLQITLSIEQIDRDIENINKQHSFLMKDKNSTPKNKAELNEIYQTQLSNLKDTRQKLVNSIEVDNPKVLNTSNE